MVPPDSPLVALAQQGFKTAGNIATAAPTVGNHQGEPSGGNWSQDRAKRGRSEAAAAANGNRHLADNDTHRQITQNRRLREYGRDRDDLRNIIDDRRRNRARTLTPPRCSPEWAATPAGRGGFHALAPSLRQVNWPDKFKPESIDRYDGSSNPKEFIQLYHTAIEAALSNASRSWLINLPEALFTVWTSYVSRSSITSRAHTSARLQPKHIRLSRRSMMKAFGTTWNISNLSVMVLLNSSKNEALVEQKWYHQHIFDIQINLCPFF
jgi:hypothetical protein